MAGRSLFQRSVAVAKPCYYDNKYCGFCQGAFANMGRFLSVAFVDVFMRNACKKISAVL